MLRTRGVSPGAVTCSGRWTRVGVLTPSKWAVWNLPSATRCLVCVVTVLAAVCTVAGVWFAPMRGRDLLLSAVLLGAGVVSVEATRKIPEPAGINANDMLGAWWVPMAVLLPPVYVLLAPIPLMALTQWRVRHISTFKRVYTAAAIGLAHAAGSVMFHALPRSWTDWGSMSRDPVLLALAVSAAAVLTKVLNTGLVGVAVKTSDPEVRWVDVFVVDSGRLEITEVCAGVLMTLIVGMSPWLVLIGLPPVLLSQRGMLYAQLHAAARTDAKTGLLNPVAWEREVAAELADGRRHGQAGAVLLLDIDHFKQVNDTYGHLLGDDVLRGIADVLRGQLRGSKDLICRFGGEEFAVFMPGVDAMEAAQVAERLRCGIAELVVPLDGALVQVTVSVGVNVADPLSMPDASVVELLAGADVGLYQAKGGGRDQVRLIARPDRRSHPS